MKKIKPILITLVLVAFSLPALTFDCPPKPEEPEKTKALAGYWFKKGESLAGEERYEQAVEAFECSISMMEHPSTVFNAAQAARLAEDNVKSQSLLKRYLELEPDGPMANNASKLLEQIEAQLLEEPPEMEDTDTDMDMEDTDTQTDDEDNETSISPLSTAGFVTAGVGGALLITAVTLNALATQAKSNGESTHSYSDYLEHEKDLTRLTKGAVITYIIGAVAAGAGVTMIVLDQKNSKKEPSKKDVEVKLVPSINGLILQGSF